MTNTQINERMITEYLLASLSEEDTERLDELTFTDKNFAERVDTAEKDLIDAFVQDELSGGALDRFTSHYLASPRRRQKVGFARALKDFAAKQADAEKIPPTRIPAAAEVGMIRRFFNGFASSVSGLGFGFAAAALAVIAIVGGLLVFMSRSLPPRMDERAASLDEAPPVVVGNIEHSALPAASATNANSDNTPAPVKTGPDRPTRPVPSKQADGPGPAAPVIASFVLLPPMRSAVKLQEIRLGQSADQAAFTLTIEEQASKRFSAQLRDPDSGRVYWQSGRLSPQLARGLNTLTLKVPAKLLTPRTYTFTVTALSTSGEAQIIGDYPFRVVR